MYLAAEDMEKEHEESHYHGFHSGYLYDDGHGTLLSLLLQLGKF